jgi:hypothetical protein
MEQNRTCWGLLRRRHCLVPTLRAWLLLALGLAVLAFIGMRATYPFLAVNDPAPGGVLVVEGWVPDATLEAAMAEFNRNQYSMLLVSGIPLDQGAPLSEYKNYAYLGAAILLKLGMATNQVQAVPTPLTERDRTYAMASSVKAWLLAHQMSGGNVNLITLGPHARRSRLMFEAALGRGFKVGVLAIPARAYDERHWWRSSAGVRVVTSEAIAYAYARFLFHAPKDSGVME